MSSATQIKEELELIKQEDINILLNQPNDHERMQAAIDELKFKEEVKKYVAYWTEAWTKAIKYPETNQYFGLETLEEIPVPRNLQECKLDPTELTWKLEKEKRAEIEKDWPDWLRMID